MKITKTYTKTYDIYESYKCTYTFGETMAAREKICKDTHNKGLDKCFVCGYNFKNDDIPWLSFVKNHRNVFLCETCAKQVENNIKVES